MAGSPIERVTHHLGRTRLPVSPLGLGLAALARPAYITLDHAGDLGADRSVEALRDRSHQLLDAAFAAGVRYIDAARSYGRAEEFLAAWLRDRGLTPDDVTVGSKWGYTYVGEWQVAAERHEVSDLGADALRRQLPETRSLLGPHLRLYQIHSATVASGVLDDADVLGELRELRATGVAVGLTVTGPRQSDTIERALDLGLFDVVQATWNLLERSAATALAQAHDAGLGVIVKEALANGRLTDRGGEPLLVEEARRRNQPADAIALAAALAQPWADVVLSGAVTAGQLHSNLAALQVAEDVTLVERLAGLATEPADYWSKRGELAWN